MRKAVFLFENATGFTGPYALSMVGSGVSSGDVTVTRIDGQPFRVSSIVVSETNSAIDPRQVTFYGTRVDGSSVLQSYTTIPGL